MRFSPVDNTKFVRTLRRHPSGPTSDRPAASLRPGHRPHVIYLAIGFPPAAKSSTYRLRATANQFASFGWDVTVINLCERAWEREFGIDHTLMAGVDPRIRIVELPLVRQDLETDIRRFPEVRALSPAKWRAAHDKRVLDSFPDPVFGGFRAALEKAVLHVHRKHPADLLMTSCAPYVNLAATWRLWEEHGVPYVVDFRDGWSIDVISGEEAFAPDSTAGRWEHKVLAEALAVWCVNDPIAGFYRDRYPAIADRVHVVRNGYDEDSLPDVYRRPRPEQGLTFGYLGSINFSPAALDSILTAWRIARRLDPVVARSRMEFRGHMGAGALRGANSHSNLLDEHAEDGVTFGGPVPKADVSALYAGWDVLMLPLVGGRFVTSGKVYEVMASGLPIVSAHEIEHDASHVLAGHPLWTGAVGLDARPLADLFVEGARLAVEATDDQREQARAHARKYARGALMRPAVREVSALVGATTRELAE
jgi:glycosyltransferase involved in cell wall biosynthesis